MNEISDQLRETVRPTLRDARQADAPALCDLVRRGLDEFGMWVPGNQDLSDVQHLEQTYIDPGGMFAVVEADAQIVGSVGLKPRGNGEALLARLFLDAPWRGLGIGRELVQRTLDHARATGVTRVVLYSSHLFEQAGALYEQFGFRIEACDHEKFTHCCIRKMVLELDQPKRGETSRNADSRHG